MNTEIFNRFKEDVHHAIGLINILDGILIIAKEKIQDYKSQNTEEGDISPIIIPGYEQHFKENNEIDQLGIIPQKFSDLEKNMTFVMIKSCSNSIVSLITIVEVYLRDLVEWIFSEKPEIFKSSKEIKLTYKEIIDSNIENQYLKTMIVEKTWNDISRKNLANSIIELFEKIFNWDLSKMASELGSLKDLSAIRNIIAHNNSRINQIFLNTISTPEKYNLGDELIINPEIFKQNAKKIFVLIKKLDELAYSKCK